MFISNNNIQTSLLLVSVDVLRSHKLTYERGLAHSPRAQQGHRVGRDVVATVLCRRLHVILRPLMMVPVAVVVMIVVVSDRRSALFAGIVFLGQAVASRPTFPERIASVHDTCANRHLSFLKFARVTIEKENQWNL